MFRSYIVTVILALIVSGSAILLVGCGQDRDGSASVDPPGPATSAGMPSEPTAAPPAVAVANEPAMSAAPAAPAVARTSAVAPLLTALASSAQPPTETPLPAPAQEVPTETPSPVPTKAPTETPDPTATHQPVEDHSPTVVPEPSARAEPTAVIVEPSPTPTAELTPTETAVVVEGEGGSGSAEVVAVTLRNATDLPTTEIVKILAPSVVDIATEIAGVQTFNSPILPSGAGTGIVLDLDGHVLTNNHVIEDAERISVTLHDGSNYPAEVVGLDRTTDLAVIKIDAENLQPAVLGDSSELLVGEDVIAIGHALDLSGAPTVSKGVVSALARSLDTVGNVTMIDLIQTDASINPGNSGGPLVNNKAEVIGVNTAIFRGGQGIGFAINIDDAKVVARQLIDQGYVTRGYLGVLPAGLTPALVVWLGFDPDIEGILLREVLEGTPAHDAGLRQGDVIQMIGSHTLRNTGELSKFLISHQPGTTVDFVVIRDGEEITGQITLGARPEN